MTKYLYERQSVLNKNNPTVDQHYVPQVYLRGFSPDYKGNKDKEKYVIHCFDLTNNRQFDNAIPIKSICFKKKLYEVTGEDGEIVLLNYLEDFFKILEGEFGKYRSKLEHKVYIKENYKTRSFLDSNEKYFWLTYIMTQILRIPQVLDIAEQTGKEIFKDDLNDKQAKNLSRLVCLPFFEEMREDSAQVKIFNLLYKPMQNMSFTVGVDYESKIVTSDMPVFISSKTFPCEEYKKIIFPITSSICLIMLGEGEKDNYFKNTLFPIDDKIRTEIFNSITSSAFRFIYSNRKLDTQELTYINNTINEKRNRNDKR